jgi:hypothetical protein
MQASAVALMLVTMRYNSLVVSAMTVVPFDISIIYLKA